MHKLLLFGLMFMFIFGWKLTPSIDLIAVVSLVLCAVAMLHSRWSFTRLESGILLVLAFLCAYSILIVTIHGAADMQVALRGLRALLNFTGGMALARLYFVMDRDCGGETALVHLFLCFAVHAGIVIAMFLEPELRLAVYARLDTLSYINNTASVELGLRNTGLTYGLSQTSVLHVSGLLLIPVVLQALGRGVGTRLLVWTCAVVIVASLFLTGRSGLVIGAITVPLMFILATRGETEGRPVRMWTTVLVLAVFLSAGVAVYRLAPELLPEQFVTSLARAEEAVAFFLTFGDTPTTQFVSKMYFLPESWHEFLLGGSNLGRGSLGYVASDVGYVRLVFAIGAFGLLLTLAPYALAASFSLRCIVRGIHVRLAAALLLSLAGTLLLNFKELAILTRNQWSVQAILISVLVLQCLRSFAVAERAASTPGGVVGASAT